MAHPDDRAIVSQPKSGYNNRPTSGYPMYSSSDNSRRQTPVELAQIMAKRVDRNEEDFLPGLADLEKVEAVVVQQQMAIDIKGTTSHCCRASGKNFVWWGGVTVKVAVSVPRKTHD